MNRAETSVGTIIDTHADSTHHTDIALDISHTFNKNSPGDDYWIYRNTGSHNNRSTMNPTDSPSAENAYCIIS
jgi:hypothetical protein